MKTIEQVEALAIVYLRFVSSIASRSNVQPAHERTRLVEQCEVEIEAILRHAREQLPAEWRARRLANTLLGVRNLLLVIEQSGGCPMPDTARALSKLQLECYQLAGRQRQI
jgi:hypothetical protein